MEGLQFVYPMGLILGPSILHCGNSQLRKHSAWNQVQERPCTGLLALHCKNSRSHNEKIKHSQTQSRKHSLPTCYSTASRLKGRNAMITSPTWVSLAEMHLSGMNGAGAGSASDGGAGSLPVSFLCLIVRSPFLTYNCAFSMESLPCIRSLYNSEMTSHEALASQHLSPELHPF